MAVSFDKIIQSLKENKYAPVYFLQGEEPYFIDIVSDYIAANALTDSEKGFNQTIMYGKDTDTSTIINACKRYPLMASRQVIIVKEAQLLKGLPDMEAYFEKPVPTTVLVMCHKYKSLDKRLKVSKVLEKNALVMDSKKVPENKLPDWIEKMVKAKGFTIAPRAAHLIIEYIGSDLEKLSNGLDKIMTAHDKALMISEKDIEANIGISREYNIFELTRALAEKDMDKTAKMVKYISSHSKDAPFPMVIAILYGFFSKATALYFSKDRSREGMKALGIMEWGQKDYTKALQTYGYRLPGIMALLLEYDLRFKGVNDSGTADAELLREMIYKITLG